MVSILLDMVVLRNESSLFFEILALWGDQKGEILVYDYEYRCLALRLLRVFNEAVALLNCCTPISIDCLRDCLNSCETASFLRLAPFPRTPTLTLLSLRLGFFLREKTVLLSRELRN